MQNIFILLFSILLFPKAVNAQVIARDNASPSITKQVISPLGGSLSSSSHKLSYTTGEVVVGAMTAEDGSVQLGNGYYPSLDLEVLSIETPSTNLVVKVFPNPVTEALYITHPTAVLFEVQITDVTGKQLFKKTHQKGNPIAMQPYTSGIYLVTVTAKKTNQSNTYKIIKR